MNRGLAPVVKICDRRWVHRKHFDPSLLIDVASLAAILVSLYQLLLDIQYFHIARIDEPLTFSRLTSAMSLPLESLPVEFPKLINKNLDIENHTLQIIDVTIGHQIKCQDEVGDGIRVGDMECLFWWARLTYCCVFFYFLFIIQTSKIIITKIFCTSDIKSSFSSYYWPRPTGWWIEKVTKSSKHI